MGYEREINPANAAQLQEGHAPSGAELRGAPRYTLLVRMAKLVADGREYLCVLRDASATGCKIKLLNPLPIADGYALETGSGERYPMELMWYREDHAGFRFYAEADVHALIEDKRGQYPKRQIRLNVDRPAVLFANGRELPVRLRNISQQGACVELEERLMLRQTVRIETDGFPPIFAKVVWRDMPRYGLVFDKGFLLEEMAAHMVRMHENDMAANQRMRAAS